jgi:SNF2 family DNA or RNA helicase
MQYTPYPYQQHATSHILDNPAAGLFLDMGLGKTVSTLTAIDHLMYHDLEVNKVLVIAPKRVAEDTWISEVEKWDHLRHLKISIVLGAEKQRKAALAAKADIYVINRENVVWLVGYYANKFPFDMVVIDELSSFKSSKAQRFRALRRIRPQVTRVVGLTGTPAPNSLIDLWPQLYLLDQGERLGKTISQYREQYFLPVAQNGNIVYKYGLKKDVQPSVIYDKIRDICVSMKAKDYLQLPGRIDRMVDVRLSPELQKKYEDFERIQILALAQEAQITAMNAAALNTKLLQFANGAIYDEQRNVHEIHDAKLEALHEIVEAANGQPVLVFYSYQHDLSRIKHSLRAFKPEELEGREHIQRWNEGKVPLLLAHPASAGHGLNMQAGGNIIVWFGLTWSLELYQQANARLDRQGQQKPVIIHHLVTKGTMDEDVMKALEGKAQGQDALMEAVKARIEKYLKRK